MNIGMSNELEIRESVQADHAAIESLYPQAFPDKDLLPLGPLAVAPQWLQPALRAP